MTDAINSAELFQYLTTHTTASNENVIFELVFALERRIACLESQLKLVRQQPLTMQQLYERRQEKLDYYRQQYGPHIRAIIRMPTLTLTLSLALIYFEWHERSLKRCVFVVFPCANEVLLTFCCVNDAFLL